MTYLERLEKADSLLCLGLDPVPSKFPPGFSPDVEGTESFLKTFLEAALKEGLLPPTLKPNLAYFEQLGWRGWKLLESLVKEWSQHCLIILDCKRGDIGPSSEAYAKAMFEGLQGDAVTLHPWMGPDSIAPFIQHFPQRGAYLLLRTSNPGGDALQKGSWQSLFREIDSWDPSSSLGFVVGATRPAELEWVLAHNEKARPLLIPGVGSQGGSAEDTARLLKSQPLARRHRVNVSSAVLFAHQGGQFPADNLKALENLQKVFGV